MVAVSVGLTRRGYRGVEASGIRVAKAEGVEKTYKKRHWIWTDLDGNSLFREYQKLQENLPKQAVGIFEFI